MRSALEGLDGVESANVSLDTDNAVMVFDSVEVTLDQMKQAVKGAGYGVSSVSAIESYTQADAGSPAAKQTSNSSTGYRTLAIEVLAKVVDDPDVTLVNVHIPYAGEIPGTDIFIPFNRINENTDKLPGDKNAEIVLYCRSGHMSKLASQTLVEMGYTNVYDVPGGMNAWRQSGRDLLNKQQ